MNHSEIAELRRKLREDNESYTEQLVRLPEEYWSEGAPETMRQMWRSRGYLAQVHDDGDGLLRIAICRTDLDKDTGRPLNDIPFKTLQQLKNDMGFGDNDATILLPVNEDWADFGGFTTLYIHPYRLAYGERKEPKPKNLIIIPK